MAGFYRAEQRDFPLAVRPAVEIIAKLSAERNRLREELSQLREELRLAPRPEELEQLRRERDALTREVADLRSRPAPAPAPAGSELTGMVDRLERAVARLERVGARSPAAAPAALSTTTTHSAPRHRTPAHSAPAVRPPSARSQRIPGQRNPLGGMLGGLVKANIALREADGAGRSEETNSRPAPRSMSGNSLLGGLVAANKELRSAGLQRRRSA